MAISTSWDSTLRLWDTKKGINLHTFQGHTEGKTLLNFFRGWLLQGVLFRYLQYPRRLYLLLTILGYDRIEHFEGWGLDL